FLQQLRLLEPYDLGGPGFLSAEHIHLVTECAKLAFADREAWYGDPDFGRVPLDELLSRDYADERRRIVGDRASLELRPGTPGGDQQDQWTLEFFLAHAVFGHDLQAAIDAPMFHTSHFPSSFAPHEANPGRLHSEPMAHGVLETLRRRGHDVVETQAWSLG